MSDRAEVEAAIYDFATAIDTKDWELFRSLLRDDVHLRYGELEWREAEPAVAEFAAAHAPLSESMHRIMNLRVKLAGAGLAEARSYCDAILIRRDAPGADTLQVTGVYSDRLERSGDGAWRFAYREFRAVQHRGSFAVLGDPERIAASFGDATALRV